MEAIEMAFESFISWYLPIVIYSILILLIVKGFILIIGGKSGLKKLGDLLKELRTEKKDSALGSFIALHMIHDFFNRDE